MWEAASNGHAGVIVLLLADPRCDPSAKNQARGQICVYWASNFAHQRSAMSDVTLHPVSSCALYLMPPSLRLALQLLLGWSSLHMAADGGFADVVALLLADPRVDPTAKDDVRGALEESLR